MHTKKPILIYLYSSQFWRLQYLDVLSNEIRKKKHLNPKVMKKQATALVYHIDKFHF